MRIFMKKVMTTVIMISICAMLFGNGFVTTVSAEEAMPKVGDNVMNINEKTLNTAGYTVIDDRNASIIYTWPYSLDTFKMQSDVAFGGTLSFQAGQVGASVKYSFSGSYIAVAFAETYYAAEVIVNIDGKAVGSFTPFNAEAPKEKALCSKIVFVKNDLAEGDHEIIITHKKAYTSGDQNIKPDGQAYNDNDAMFDCFIVKTEVAPTSVKAGMAMAKYNDEILTSLGYKVIDDRNEDVIYLWPYDIEGAKLVNNNAYNKTISSNCGQVSGTISYDFEGTFIAVAFCDTYFACKINIDIDGEVIGEITPHSDFVSVNKDDALQSKIVFAKEDLLPGDHVITITHEAGHTTGEDNTKEDGTTYYDNNAMFDCFIVQSNPADSTAKPDATATATATPVASAVNTTGVKATPTVTKIPDNKTTKGNNLFWIIPLISAFVIASGVGAFVIIKRKHKNV